MLKIDVDDGKCRITGSGSMPDISTELVMAVREIRNCFKGETDRWAFDFFLKDIFVDLVLADGASEVTNILTDSIRRFVENEA